MCFVSYEQINYWSMPRAIRSSLFLILMPKTKLRHAQSTFSSSIHSLFPALWRLKCEQKVRSGQDNYKLLDKSNITAHLVLSIYNHRELFAIGS